MKDFVRALSGRAEFLVVVIGAFGLFLLSNVILLFDPSAMPQDAGITNESLRSLAVYELLVMAMLGAFLNARGWTFERMGMQVSLRDTVIGAGLTALIYVISMLIESLATSFAPATVEMARRMQLVAEPLGVGNVAFVSLINGVFEEVFVCAYVISALKDRRGVAFAINVSIGLRVGYHLYQGPLGAITIAPLGLLFAFWYVKSGRVWPLIVAHTALDFMGLMQA